jgi:hypothetical protein
VKINLKDEFKYHSKCLKQLDIFEDLQMSLDYGYFKNFVSSFIDEKEVFLDQRTIDKQYDVSQLSSTEDIVSQLDRNLYTEILHTTGTLQDFRKTKKRNTFLTPEMEKAIPQEPVRVNQNRKLTALWYEAKEQLDQVVKSKRVMTTEEIAQQAELPEVKKFFQ